MFVEAESGLRAADFRFNTEKIRTLPNGAMELAMGSVDQSSEASSWLIVRCYPGEAALELARIENHGLQTLALIRRIAPLAISVRAAGRLHAYSSDPGKRHGTVRSAGMEFGLWVDPGNVDSSRVASGEIPDKWLAKIDGKPLQSKHPSLSPMTQLCLGDPEVG